MLKLRLLNYVNDFLIFFWLDPTHSAHRNMSSVDPHAGDAIHPVVGDGLVFEI